MRVTLLAVMVLYLIDSSFLHGGVTALLITTAMRLSNATVLPALH